MKLLKTASVFLLGMLIVCATGTTCVRAADDPARLKILDINVWSGLDYVGYLTMGTYEDKTVREERYQALVQQIRMLDPDLIGVHEANKLPGYARRLAADLGCQAFFHVGVGGVRLGPVGLPWNLREGDAILAKPRLNPEFTGRRQLSGGYVGKWVTFHFEDATQVIGIRVTVAGKPVHVYATHWHASLADSPAIFAKAETMLRNHTATPEEYRQLKAEIRAGIEWRLAEARKTLAFIDETAGQNPVILMGDFNAESRSLEVRSLVEHGLVDTFAHRHGSTPGYTWDPATNLNQKLHYLNSPAPGGQGRLREKIDAIDRTLPGRIDYIFVGPEKFVASGNTAIIESRVVMQKVIGGVHASDHYGIFTVLSFGRP